MIVIVSVMAAVITILSVVSIFLWVEVRRLRRRSSVEAVLRDGIMDDLRETRQALAIAGQASGIKRVPGERQEVTVDQDQIAKGTVYGPSRAEVIARAKERAELAGRLRAETKPTLHEVYTDQDVGHYGDDDGNAHPQAVANQPRNAPPDGVIDMRDALLRKAGLVRAVADKVAESVADAGALIYQPRCAATEAGGSRCIRPLGHIDCHMDGTGAEWSWPEPEGGFHRSGCTLDRDHTGPCEEHAASQATGPEAPQ